MSRLVSVQGRAVDCGGCHRPVPDGEQYWNTDDGAKCDDCFMGVPPRSSTVEAVSYVAVILFCVMAILIGILVIL